MAGGLGPAYGQTDVMHDRSYLTANLAHHNRAVRQQARDALDNLNYQESLQQRDAAMQQRQMNVEASQRRITAHQNALEMDKQLKIDRDTEIDEQGHGLLLSMMQLDAARRRGSITKDQYDQGLLNSAAQFPLGLKHPEAKKHFDFVTTEADRQNAFNDRRQAAEATKLSAKYGVPVQTDPATGLPSVQATHDLAAKTPRGQIELSGQGPVPEKIAQRYDRLQGMSDQYSTAYQQDIKRQEALNTAALKENVPYNPNLDQESRVINSTLPGVHREIQALEKSYPQLNPNNQVQQAQSVSTPAPAPSPTTSAAPVPIPPANQWNFLGLAPGATIQPTTTPAAAQPSSTPDQTPVSTPSPSPEATATPDSTVAPAQTPVHLGRYNPETGEFE